MEESGGAVSLDRMEDDADYMLDALDVYDRFVDEELYKREELPSEVRGDVTEVADGQRLEESGLDEGIAAGIMLAVEIADMYKDLAVRNERYLEQADSGPEAVQDIKKVREATSRAFHSGAESAVFFQGEEGRAHGEVPDQMSVNQLLNREADIEDLFGTALHH